MGGSSTLDCLYIPCSLNAVYGTLGTPSTDNHPGSRSPAASWTDENGHFWLFGGAIAFMPAKNPGGCTAFLNDLWEYDVSSKEWTWVSGSNPATLSQNPLQLSYSVCGPAGSYGTLGVPAAGNVPGGRQTALEWTDGAGDFWVFGGYGLDSRTTFGYLNDLWRFRPSTSEWTWMGGSSEMACAQIGPPWCSQNGVYGTLGTPAAGNIPGGRSSATGWIDSSGRFWLFGGGGDDPNGHAMFDFNDLWMFDPSTKEWAWMGGSNHGGQAGVYGTLGAPTAGNVPGSRSAASGWTDNSGNLWMFGGHGTDANGTEGYLNDMWKFNPFTSEWAWMAGSSTSDQLGIYGTQGVSAAGNTPGARERASNWNDVGGNLWLFGGAGIGANSAQGYLNDLWEFNPSSDQWAWIDGSGTVPPTSNNNGGQPGVYGTLGVPAAGNIPGGRSGASNWTDGNGSLWMYGGDGIDAASKSGYLDDLWAFNPPAGSIPVTARPVFSETGGTYTSAQTISISDATPGATIYYTTDGVTIPTASSMAYSGSIPVSSSETIIAIAVSTGYSNSPVTSAVYTINLPSFTVAGAPVTVLPGATTGNTSVITLTPTGGFIGDIRLTAAITASPSGAAATPTLSFGSTNPVHIAGVQAGTAILTIATTLGQAQPCTAKNRVPRRIPWYTGGGAVLACVLLAGIPARRRTTRSMLGGAVSVLVLLTGGLGACGGGGSKGCDAPTAVTPSTTAGVYTITVTGISGTITATGTVALTVR